MSGGSLKFEWNVYRLPLSGPPYPDEDWYCEYESDLATWKTIHNDRPSWLASLVDGDSVQRGYREVKNNEK